jgi:hypothetical protein
METLREAGGVNTTILDDAMQRAPAFMFESAREARAFGAGLTEHLSLRSSSRLRPPPGPGDCVVRRIRQIRVRTLIAVIP